VKRTFAKNNFLAALALLAAGIFPAAAQTNFATLIADGAYTWYNDPRALFNNGQLYFGYVRAADSKSALSVFNLQSGLTTNLFSSGFTQLDDHNNPGLLVKPDGAMLAVYSRHISDQYFAWRLSATNPASPAAWNAEQTLTASGASMTYANPFQLANESGKIFNFCRNQNFNPTVYTSTNGGTNWSAPQLFIQTGTGGTIRPYVKYASNNTNRLDFLYTDGHPRDVTNSLYHLYYQSNAFYKTDGTFVKNYSALPILHDSGERGSVIYQYSDADSSSPDDHIPTGRAWCWETSYQTNGAPVCVFTVQRDKITGTNQGTDDRIYYYYARWTGTNWQKRFIAQAGRPIYSAENDYAGGICVDPQDANTIYLSSNAQNPFALTDTTNVTLSANSRYELWRGTTADGGLNFSWTPITTNSTQDNFRPYIPRRNGGERCVIWFRGSYSSYTSYSCSIVGLFTTAVPTNFISITNPPLSLTYVDATAGAGGNTTLANGSTFSPPLNTSTAGDNLWKQRTVLGSGGNVFEAGGDGAENAPELRASLTNLIPAANYALYAFFWDATGNTENWSLRAGFTSAPGTNPLYSAADATGLLGATGAVLASSLTYTVAPTLFVEANRVLQAAALGNTTADSNGVINVFPDDKPSTIGANNRTWFDGLGWALLTAAYPTNLNFTINGSNLTLAWPATHLGWTLQVQTNSLASGIQTAASAWFNVPGSASVTTTNLVIQPSSPSVFYRLRHP
jgi:hypothetical protein